MDFNPNSYLNRNERNVHVWGSSLTEDGKPGLVAGCFTSDRLTIAKFYIWIDMIAQPSETELKKGRFVLFRLGFDVITTCFESPGRPTFDDLISYYHPLPDQCLGRTSNELLEAGDYLIYVWENPQNPHLESTIPILLSLKLDYRKKSRTPSAASTTSSGGVRRSDKTRTDVRIRDLHCRVTGQVAPERARGRNFVGLQVAHVFPLGWFKNAVDICWPEDWAALRVIQNDPDIPQNAILLRADIHAYVDHYQLGFYGPQSELHVFERNGAPSFNPIEHRRLKPKLTLNNLDPGLPDRSQVPDVSEVLLKQHFRTCLLWHVAGIGRERDRNALGGVR